MGHGRPRRYASAARQRRRPVPQGPARRHEHIAYAGVDGEEQVGRHRYAGRACSRHRVGREQRSQLGREVRGLDRIARVHPGDRRLLDDRQADDAVGQDPAIAVPRVRGDGHVPAHHVRCVVRAAAPARSDQQRPARLLRPLRSAHGRRSLLQHARVRARLQGLHGDDSVEDDVAEGLDAAQAPAVGRHRRATRARREPGVRRVRRRDSSQQARGVLHGARAELPVERERRGHREHVQPGARSRASRRRAARALAGERDRPHARREGRQTDRRVARA